MPFLFSYVCDLLQRLDDNRAARSGLRSNTAIVRDWFRAHQAHFYRDDHSSAALLSALLPEKRSDRVYLIQEKKLQAVIGRALGLGRSRIAQLSRWSNPEARVDLAECVESILRETPNPVSPSDQPVTVEEIDGLLHSIASTCRFSSPAVRSSAAEIRLADLELALGELFRRLSARDAKWLTRLILKNYEPVVLDPHVVYARRILDSHRRDRTVTGRNGLVEYLKPALGVKVGRQTWIKGRSIKHCLSMLQGRVSCEEKVDGEYCQIHIDLSKGYYDCIQIFSKSGKDSTRDRIAVHDSIRKSLQIGQPSCPVKHGCILEGELVVYSDKHSKILDFHKIRKHVSRSGTFIGTDQDSQAHHWEHLMIVYYDVLMIDNESLLAVKHSERFRKLQDLITEVPGRSALVKREIIDCSRPSAASDLRRAFAKCITSRREGLVLKADDPFFDFGTSRRPYSCCVVKLKKEYIGHFGEIGDFAVVGARFDTTKARTYNIPGLKWTHFYVGCLENKDEVQRFGRQPHFVVTNVVELSPAQLRTFVCSVNPEAVRLEDNTTAITLRIEPGIDNGKRPSVVFPSPPVVDLRCFSFDKEGNTGFWSPRFPSVSKIHCDRTFHDALSFAELQEMARKEKEMPPPDDSQELLGWIAALENAEPTTVDPTSQSTVATAATITTPMTPSPPSSDPNRLQTAPSPALPTISGMVSARKPREAPVGAQLTPPRSSAVQIPETKSPDSVGHEERASRGQKRTRDETAQSATTQNKSKIRRCSANQFDQTVPSPRGSTETTASERVPLTDVRAVSSRRNTDANLPVPGLPNAVSMPPPNSENAEKAKNDTSRRSLPASVSFHQDSSPVLAGPSLSKAAAVTNDARDGGTSGSTSGQTTDSTSGKCRYLPDSCKLSNYSILLSPCISNFPWVTEDLLSGHGVTSFIRDPKAWAVSQHTAVEPGAHKSRRGRKMVLVDARRREATETFLRSIQDAQLRRRNGEREYVPVYDWRVLESLRDEERQCDGRRERPGARFDVASSQSIWRRFWVGLA